MTTDDTPAEIDSGDAKWFLNDEREFLVRSLHDAELEHDAGDLNDDDFAVLTTRDRARLAEVEAELAAASLNDAVVVPPPPSEVIVEPRNKDWRRVGIIGACFLIVAGAVILVDHAINPRLPGQASSGSVTVSKQQLIEEQLTQALSLNDSGQVVAALKLYNKVLSEDPNDPQALAASGWLDWNYGTAGHSPILLKEGRQNEEKAIKVAPTFYGGHLFLGLILLNQDKNAPGAVAEFNKFLADNPTTAQVKADAALLAVAYVEAGVPVPSQLITSTTTTTTSAP
jgi:tetratricopeptide (TPR) repeat protein